MNRIYIIGIASLFYCLSAPIKAQDPAAYDTLLARLQALPDMEVVEIAPGNGYPRQFQIDLLQPVDHLRPEGPHFYQRIYLSHKDTTLPMVFRPSGYTASRRRVDELTTLFESNQIEATHRYMAGAVPDELDWQFLTIEQAAADHHRIVSIFKEIYPAVWASSGGSKNGLTVLYHKRFYPDDVAASVAFVAPLMTANPDPRILQYIEESLGDSTCHSKAKAFQRNVLENIDEIIPHLSAVLDSMGGAAELGPEFIAQLLVLEYPFYFWSVGDGDCIKIPDNANDPTTVIDHFLEYIWLWEFTDEGREYFRPTYYQLFTEIGYYGHDIDHLTDLIDMQYYPALIMLPPQDVDVTFRPEVMEDIISWLEIEGNNIIYIYGELDPWTATALTESTSTNSFTIIQPGANHYVKIADLDEQSLVISALEEWLGLEIDGSEMAVEPGAYPGSLAEGMELPVQFNLAQNYPNPFNPISTIRYDLPHRSEVRLAIYGLLGREVRMLVRGLQEPGNHQTQWNGQDQTGRPVPSGIYIARLVTPEYNKSIKMLLLR
jgi:hypothetical protein